MTALAGLDLSADGYLVDLDGTLVSGGQALPWAHQLLEPIAERCVIVSNDAEHTSHQLCTTLGSVGLRLPASRIVLAGEYAVRVVAEEHPGARIMLLASAALRRYAARIGLRLSDTDPEIVLVGRDRSFSYRSLDRAAVAIHRGASMIIANPDQSHPAPDGSPVPETGAIAAAILAASGHPPHRIIGKPQPELFRAGLERLGCPADAAIMIGDNPATDGAGAKAAGIAFFHLRAQPQRQS